MSEELKPCPFCGGEAMSNEIYGNTSNYWEYGCGDCQIWGYSAEDWNRRTPPPATARRMEAIRAVLASHRRRGMPEDELRRFYGDMIAELAEWPAQGNSRPCEAAGEGSDEGGG